MDLLEEFSFDSLLDRFDRIGVAYSGGLDSTVLLHLLAQKKDLKGKIIEGDSNQILTIDEKWSFSKNLKSNDPNWTLEKIEESN